jgi:hypothetical protein
MGPFKNELTVVTGYSEKPIFQIFGKNLNYFAKKEMKLIFVLFIQKCSRSQKLMKLF